MVTVGVMRLLHDVMLVVDDNDGVGGSGGIVIIMGVGGGVRTIWCGGNAGVTLAVGSWWW